MCGQGLIDEGFEVQGEDMKKDVLHLEWYGSDYDFCNMEGQCGCHAKENVEVDLIFAIEQY